MDPEGFKPHPGIRNLLRKLTDCFNFCVNAQPAPKEDFKLGASRLQPCICSVGLPLPGDVNLRLATGAESLQALKRKQSCSISEVCPSQAGEIVSGAGLLPSLLSILYHTIPRSHIGSLFLTGSSRSSLITRSADLVSFLLPPTSIPLPSAR